MATWRELITFEMSRYGESWDDVEAAVIDNIGQWSPRDCIVADFDHDFDDGYGSENGAAFTVWTANHVYFPACYDGSEWCGSVSRNPCDTPNKHIGG